MIGPLASPPEEPVTRAELLAVVLVYIWAKLIEREQLWLDIEDHLAASRR
jgi:hypothetical protein